MPIHISRGDESSGPYSLEEVQEFLDQGLLLSTDLAWQKGLDEWIPLSELVRQLPVMESAPPPLAPLIGWEVYARKMPHYGTPGVVLAAGATTLGKGGKKLYQESTFTQTPLFYSLEAFAYNCHQVKTTVADFVETFGEADNETLHAFLKDQLGGTNSLLPAATAADGFVANAIALKANEAVNTGKRIEITDADITV